MPTVEGRGESAGLGDVRTGAGKTAWHRRLSPSHRRAVGAFFAPTPTAAESGGDR